MGLIEQLELYCQPIYQVTTLGAAQPCDYEVLLRKKGGRPLLPQELYATTATTSARQALRQWMLAQLAHFADHQPRLTIDVNIDPWQFHYPDVWDYLAQLRQVGPQINIEITERNESSFDAAANFGRLLARAQNLGFAISLDDVGSGYNSLQAVIDNSTYLSRIKFSLLLFQRRDQQSKLLFARACQELAASRNLDLVVEGIEDQLLAETLLKQGCHYQQGFYWQRPFPLKKLCGCQNGDCD